MTTFKATKTEREKINVTVIDSTSFLKTEVPPLGMVNSDSHGSQEGKVKEAKQIESSCHSVPASCYQAGTRAAVPRVFNFSKKVKI